ncbi:helix-turn-helix domain-containing protein [Marinicaulis aureus]|uniref:Helix-turn-helix domain-containing protein n=1 Tax=Hyphococcus aureus TaxID=2666033 RepID=A0ABW1KZ48_9PROT
MDYSGQLLYFSLMRTSPPSHSHRPQVDQPEIYALYGEQPGEFGIEDLHIEDIDARARLHDWKILPHAHSGIMQLIYISEGGAEAKTEDRITPLRSGDLVFIPEGVIHSFDFQDGTIGWVLSIDSPFLNTPHFRSVKDMFLGRIFSVSKIVLNANRKQEAETLFDRLHNEFLGSNEGRRAMLESLTQALLILTMREIPRMKETDAEPANSAQVATAYRNLINNKFCDHWTVADYANALSISQSQLTRICRLHVGKSPAALIHARVLLEAQRMLRYAEAPAAQIAFELGFQDPAYFSRFFKRLAGVTPRQYRLHSRHRNLQT